VKAECKYKNLASYRSVADLVLPLQIFGQTLSVTRSGFDIFKTIIFSDACRDYGGGGLLPLSYEYRSALTCSYRLERSPDSIVSTATGYWPDDREVRV
jgi:hypothetical protein